MTQHFTIEELEILSNTVLAMQNQLSNASNMLNGFFQGIIDAITPEHKRLAELNNKICGYMEIGRDAL